MQFSDFSTGDTIYLNGSRGRILVMHGAEYPVPNSVPRAVVAFEDSGDKREVFEDELTRATIVGYG